MIDSWKLATYEKGGKSEEYYPQEIADKLLFAATLGDISAREHKELSAQLEDALYYVKAAAENKYNSDYWRILWNVLQNLMDVGCFDIETD